MRNIARDFSRNHHENISVRQGHHLGSGLHNFQLIRRYIECALMKVYARKKIDDSNELSAPSYSSGLQGEIEQALHAANTKDIETLWRMGRKAIDKAIDELQNQFPILSQMDAWDIHLSDIEGIISHKEFSSFLVAALFGQIDVYKDKHKQMPARH